MLRVARGVAAASAAAAVAAAVVAVRELSAVAIYALALAVVAPAVVVPAVVLVGRWLAYRAADGYRASPEAVEHRAEVAMAEITAEQEVERAREARRERTAVR